MSFRTLCSNSVSSRSWSTVKATHHCSVLCDYQGLSTLWLPADFWSLSSGSASRGIFYLATYSSPFSTLLISPEGTGYFESNKFSCTASAEREFGKVLFLVALASGHHVSQPCLDLSPGLDSVCSVWDPGLTGLISNILGQKRTWWPLTQSILDPYMNWRWPIPLFLSSFSPVLGHRCHTTCPKGLSSCRQCRWLKVRSLALPKLSTGSLILLIWAKIPPLRVSFKYLCRYSEDHFQRVGQWSCSSSYHSCYLSQHLVDLSCIAMGSFPPKLSFSLLFTFPYWCCSW